MWGEPLVEQVWRPILQGRVPHAGRSFGRVWVSPIALGEQSGDRGQQLRRGKKGRVNKRIREGTRWGEAGAKREEREKGVGRGGRRSGEREGETEG